MLVNAGDAPSRITEHSADPRTQSRLHRQISKLITVGIAVLLVYWAIRGARVVIFIVAFVALLAVIPITHAFVIGRKRHGRDGLLWRGLVSFIEDDFDDRSLFPDIRRTPSSSIGRRGLSGGHLEIRSDGLSWEAGSLLTPRCELSGSFRLPWEEIETADVSDIPMKLRILGGAITFGLTDGSEIQGEFLGPRTALLQGLRLSPLSQPRQGS